MLSRISLTKPVLNNHRFIPFKCLLLSGLSHRKLSRTKLCLSCRFYLRATYYIIAYAISAFIKNNTSIFMTESLMDDQSIRTQET